MLFRSLVVGARVVGARVGVSVVGAGVVGARVVGACVLGTRVVGTNPVASFLTSLLLYFLSKDFTNVLEYDLGETSIWDSDLLCVVSGIVNIAVVEFNFTWKLSRNGLHEPIFSSNIYFLNNSTTVDILPLYPNDHKCFRYRLRLSSPFPPADAVLY